MRPKRFGPRKHRGSRQSSIDVQARLREIEKQRRIILEASDDERTQRCMRMIGVDVVGAVDDFQRAAELETGDSE